MRRDRYQGLASCAFLAVDDEAPFLFPSHMPLEVAQRLLTEAYSEVDEGKALRRTHKSLRKQGIDPPIDVQYTAQPVVAETPDGLGVFVQADILIYNEFPELEDCVDAFERQLWGLIEPRLEKAVRGWIRAHPGAAQPSLHQGRKGS